jgi:hypothetical protein
MQPFGGQQHANRQSFSYDKEVKERAKDQEVYDITGPNVSALIFWFKLIGIIAFKAFQ